MFGKRKDLFIRNKYFETEKQIFAKQNSLTNDYEKYLINLSPVDTNEVIRKISKVFESDLLNLKH